MNQSATLQVSEPGTEKFGSTVRVFTGSDQSPRFKISCSGYLKISLALPVYTSAGDKATALADEATWKMMTLKNSRLDNAELEKNTGLQTIVLTVSDPGSPAMADFSLNGFKAEDTPGSAVCYLKFWDDSVSDWVNEPPVRITVEKIKEIKKPVITVFKADRDLISSGDHITLSWKATNCHHCRLLTNGQTTAGDENLPAAGNTGKDIQPGIPKYNYSLIAYADKEETTSDTQTIDISVEGASISRFAGSILTGNTAVMGIYPYKDRLYAIILHKEAKKVFLYASENGVKHWEQVFPRNSDRPVELDIRLAGSPGVVFKDKLFLIGGSSVDADQDSNDIGYYDFEEEEWVSSASMPKKNFPASRMGHSCIVNAAGSEIWLMGGYHPSRGALNDIWITCDGMVWSEMKIGEKQITLPEGKGRCLMGATLHDGEMWIFGGYRSIPGGKSYDHTHTYKWSGKEKNWEKIKWAIEVSGFSNEYQALSLASVKNTLFLFQTSFEGSAWENFIYRFYESNGWKAQRLGGITNEWSLNQDGYSLQTSVYKSAVWIRAIEQEGNAVTDIKSSGLYYFYFVPKPQQ